MSDMFMTCFLLQVSAPLVRCKASKSRHYGGMHASKLGTVKCRVGGFKIGWGLPSQHIYLEYCKRRPCVGLPTTGKKEALCQVQRITRVTRDWPAA
eukprot:1152078-Pelagomonas_calceolata.AAC.5